MEKENTKLNPVAYWADEEGNHFKIYFEYGGSFIVVTEKRSFTTSSLLNDILHGISLFDEKSLKEYEDLIVECARRITKEDLLTVKGTTEEPQNDENREDLRILKERGLI